MIKHFVPATSDTVASEGHELVHTYHHGLVLVDVELNKKANLFSKIIFDDCPSCGIKAQEDILAMSPNCTVMGYACGCTARFVKGKEPIYTKRGE